MTKKWPRNDQEMTKKWPRNDQKMTKKWPKNDQEMTKNDQEMTKKWSRNDQEMTKKCLRMNRKISFMIVFNDWYHPFFVSCSSLSAKTGYQSFSSEPNAIKLQGSVITGSCKYRKNL